MPSIHCYKLVLVFLHVVITLIMFTSPNAQSAIIYGREKWNWTLLECYFYSHFAVIVQFQFKVEGIFSSVVWQVWIPRWWSLFSIPPPKYPRIPHVLSGTDIWFIARQRYLHCCTFILQSVTFFTFSVYETALSWLVNHSQSKNHTRIVGLVG